VEFGLDRLLTVVLCRAASHLAELEDCIVIADPDTGTDASSKEHAQNMHLYNATLMQRIYCIFKTAHAHLGQLHSNKVKYFANILHSNTTLCT